MVTLSQVSEGFDRMGHLNSRKIVCENLCLEAVAGHALRKLSSLTSRRTLSRRPWRPHAQGFAAGQRLPKGLYGCVSTRTSRAWAQSGLIDRKAKIRPPDRALPENLLEVLKSLLILIEQEQGQAESNPLGDQDDYRL
jgi:hypothetical protein